MELFLHFYGFKAHFINLEYLTVILGGSLEFWKHFDIRDGGSKMAAVSSFIMIA